MRFYKWLNSAVGSYDIFVAMDESEAKKVISIFGDAAKTCSLHGQYYYFLNTKKKAIAPLPFLSLAFGGQYNGYPPYGKELKKPLLILRRYHLEMTRYGSCKM